MTFELKPFLAEVLAETHKEILFVLDAETAVEQINASSSSELK
jgi:hypothetical protein